MTPRPVVSVCIPSYNRAALLSKAIDSVLSQTLGDYEVIVSDNASDDHTGSVVQGFSDKRIRYHRNPRNIGARDNWNRAFSLATGEYLAPFSDDDLMLPDNLAAKVEVLRTHPSVGLVHSKYHIMDHAGEIVRADTNYGHGPDRLCDAVERGRDVLRLMLLSYNRINLPTVVFRRECYERLGGFTDRLSLTDDWEYWMRICAYYDVAFLARPLIKWRLHASSLTNQYVFSAQGVMKVEAIREELLAKRLILRRHLRGMPGTAALKRQTRQALASRIVERAETMLDKGGPNPEARRFVLDMCRAVPEASFHFPVWKVLCKSMLTPRKVSVLKRIIRL